MKKENIIPITQLKHHQTKLSRMDWRLASIWRDMLYEISLMHENSRIHAHISIANTKILLNECVPQKIILRKQNLLVCDRRYCGNALRSTHDMFPEDCAPELRYGVNCYPLISPKVDVYSAGIILYYLLFGYPYRAEMYEDRMTTEMIIQMLGNERSSFDRAQTAIISSLLHRCLLTDYLYRPSAKHAYITITEALL